MNLPRLFDTDGDETFDSYGGFAADSLPEPGPFLADHDVLTGREHAAFHRLSRECFEERGVYDVTFGYNLARLNLDRRHSDSGFRYAREADDPSVLRAEFTPTTEFCPQSDTLTLGAFRAWNGTLERHEYDLVRVRTAPMHQQAVAINERLRHREAQFRETGDLSTGDGTVGESSGDIPF
ncbi:hypothetical protein KTS45_16790 [Halomicroarcula limicola]|uniref:DUF7998 domain-containing protein n=1 Tax=Haloarcula limicola TaxID=1429915 RepID=A0A8J7YCD8_9EURY|nr:hypothetical protein [Halomicroarcula limicola]MBV0925863.1 hypothetical protein [Halomicroarcula limicola]